MLICQNSYLFVTNKGTQLTTVPNETLQNAYDYLLHLLCEKRLKDERRKNSADSVTIYSIRS